MSLFDQGQLSYFIMMNMDQLFMLADDVELIAIAEITEAVKQNFAHAETDVVVTRCNTRKRSKVLEQKAADLLKNFARPTSWAQAILQHSLQTKQDPQQVAEEAFPLLMQLNKEGFLIAIQNIEQKQQGPLKPGQTFQDYTVQEICQALDDTAVYRVHNNTGKEFALKISKPWKEGQPRHEHQNEVAMLKRLDGVVNPVLMEEGTKEGMHFVVLEWCAGMDAEKAATRYRNFTIQSNALAMIDLCISIVQAYQHLHRQGIVHADVHPKNILITEKGDVRIIDYGYSHAVNENKRIIRGGVPFYYEPETAAALLLGQMLPGVTPKSEQYAIAALLFRLITGSYYLNFSLEPQKAYQQILAEKPLPFGAFDLSLPPVFDEVFTTALAKDPANRFESLQAFATALVQCRKAVSESKSFFIDGKKNPEEKFISFLIRKYGWNSKLLKNGLQVPPTSSVNFGAAGIAYLFYRMACVYEEADLLHLAEVWINRATDDALDYPKRFYTANGDISQATVGSCSLYHSPTGVHVVQALISACQGNDVSTAKAIADFLFAAASPCAKQDLTLGTAGLLVGAALLLKEQNIRKLPGAVQFKAFTHARTEELWRRIDTYPSISQPNPVGYFGIAHGWAGLLYATLLWCHVSCHPLPALFYTRVEELLSQSTQKNGFMQWPFSNESNGAWPGWCHGNAGYVLFWCLLYQHTKDDRFLSNAEQSAGPLLTRRQEAAHLCCGLAGQAYAMVKLHQLTGKKMYWQRVEEMRHQLFLHIGSPLLRNNSLYKGEVGIGVLLAELTRPELARMPLFE